MTNRALNELTAMEALAGMASGEFSSEDITEACLDRIEAREETVQAWVHIDRDQALEQARAKGSRARCRRSNRSIAWYSSCTQGYLRYARYADGERQ